MTILKQGDMGRIYKNRRFACSKCGCVFIANYKEYAENWDEEYAPYFSCICPTCENLVYEDE